MVNGKKLCLGLSSDWGTDIFSLLHLISDVGFDGYFVKWNYNIDLKEISRVGRDLGLIFQSVHAPYYNAGRMWEEEESSKIALDELYACLKDCYECGVKLVVCHAFIGFDKHTPNEYGIKNFKKVIDKAREYGIKIAFENTEGEEYLDCLMQAFSDCDNVGFCIDTGHEQCYNRGRDLLLDYGRRLLCTHINDNFGITDINNISWTDDLHLLPFDGIIDWQWIVSRFKRENYQGELTFEMVKESKPNRHENDKYEAMSTLEYVSAIYERASKIAMLF